MLILKRTSSVCGSMHATMKDICNKYIYIYMCVCRLYYNLFSIYLEMLNLYHHQQHLCTIFFSTHCMTMFWKTRIMLDCLYSCVCVCVGLSLYVLWWWTVFISPSLLLHVRLLLQAKIAMYFKYQFSWKTHRRRSPFRTITLAKAITDHSWGVLVNSLHISLHTARSLGVVEHRSCPIKDCGGALQS